MAVATPTGSTAYSVAAGGYRPSSAEPPLEALSVMAPPPSSPIWAEGIEDVSDGPVYGSQAALLARRKANRMPPSLTSPEAAGHRAAPLGGLGINGADGMGVYDAHDVSGGLPPMPSSPWATHTEDTSHPPSSHPNADYGSQAALRARQRAARLPPQFAAASTAAGYRSGWVG